MRQLGEIARPPERLISLISACAAMGTAQRGGEVGYGGRPPPSVKWALDSHADAEFVGQYIGEETKLPAIKCGLNL